MFLLRMILEMLHTVQGCARGLAPGMRAKYSTASLKRLDVILNVSSKNVLLIKDPFPLFQHCRRWHLVGKCSSILKSSGSGVDPSSREMSEWNGFISTRLENTDSPCSAPRQLDGPVAKDLSRLQTQ